MSLFRSKPKGDQTRAYWSLPGGYGMSTGATGYLGSMSIEEACRNAASYACINVLVDAISRTPLDVVRYGRPVDDPVPALIARPSGLVSAGVWRAMLGFGLVTDGNAFGLVVAQQGSYPTQIEWLDASSVVERKVVNGFAQVRVENQVHRLWPYGDVFHIPGRLVRTPGPFGDSPVVAGSVPIATSLAAEQFAYRFFIDDNHPSKAFLVDGAPTEEQLVQMKETYRRVMSGGSREPLFMSNTIDMRELQASLESTQFIDLMRWEVEQVCRDFLVPPAMVYGATSGQSVTYANVTQADLAYLKYSVDGLLVRVEEHLTLALPRPQFVKANRNAILRADVMTRYQSYELALANKFMTVNEVRELEDQPKFPDPMYDDPGVPAGPLAPAPPAAQPAPMEAPDAAN